MRQQDIDKITYAVGKSIREAVVYSGYGRLLGALLSRTGRRDIEENIKELCGDRAMKVIFYRFGLDGTGLKTLKEAGLKFGVTRERVRQIEAKGLEVMRFNIINK